MIAVAEPVFANAERLALAGFLAGYTGLTREAYALDLRLRQFTTWCRARSLPLFAVRRADSKASPGIWKPGAGPRHRHPACVRDRRVLPVRGGGKSSWSIPRPLMSGGRGWTMSLMPSR